MKAAISKQILKDLKEKMVLIGGPRQVGKTTLAISFLTSKSKQDSAYLNWDLKADRQKIQAEQIPISQPLVVLDEIHKYRNWRSLIKGYYDRYFPKVNFIVTGSARLDIYRHGGDSMQGRYHYHRLHPLSLMEVTPKPDKETVNQLLEYSGFPEPFLKCSKTFLARWRRNRLDLIFREDIRELEMVRDIGKLELLYDTLPDRISTPISVRSISRDLEVSHDAISSWLDIFENMYLCFRISPYGGPKIRAVKKEQKMYFWDWTHNTNRGSKFENLVASQLLKFCHQQEDCEGYRMELRYLRDVDGREVDFVVLKNRKPLFAVECKTGAKEASHACKYYRERTKIPKFYQVHTEAADFGDENQETRVLPFYTFCKELNLP